MPALRIARAAILLLIGAVVGFVAAIALDPGLALDDTPPHTSDPDRDPYPVVPQPETEVDGSARAVAYTRARAVAGGPRGSVVFVDADGRRWRCFEAMIP